MMSLEEEGAYIRLVAYCWQHGSIPSDPALAAKLIGKGASTTLATTVLTMFEQNGESGRLIHDRLEEERIKQELWREKSVSGGRKSAEMRAKLKGGSTVVEKCLKPNVNSPSSSPIPSPIKKNMPLEAEVVAHCVSEGLPESDGIWFWNKCEGSGWKNAGQPIKSWKGTIAAWKIAGHLPSQKTVTPRSASQNGANTVIMGKEYERVIERIRVIRSQYGDMQTWAEDDKIELKRLKVRRDELQKTLGLTV